MDMQETSTDRERLIGVYLDDHRAGAVGGLALARRMLEENSDNYLTATMRKLVSDIEHESEVLDDVITRLGRTANRLKMVVAATGERVGRLKSNGYLRGYSPLSRLEEFEALTAALLAKTSLWRNCQLALAQRPELAGIDFGALRERSELQREELEAHREQIVADAFGQQSG
jgi:hypothetical protein